MPSPVSSFITGPISPGWTLRSPTEPKAQTLMMHKEGTLAYSLFALWAKTGANRINFFHLAGVCHCVELIEEGERCVEQLHLKGLQHVRGPVCVHMCSNATRNMTSPVNRSSSDGEEWMGGRP